MSVTAPNDTPTPGPYAHAAPLYWAAGWHGILPLPPKAKKPVPTGYTGTAGVFPSYPDIHTWTEGPEGAGNLALRLPHHIVGIDVDNYDDKPGASTLTRLETAHGPLPATWRSTSRGDGISGIRLYRVPEGLNWPGDLGGGIEIIQHRHRYTVAWPSIHPTGNTYRWIKPDGAYVIGTVPHVDELPDLPDTWVHAITRGEAATDIPRLNLDTAGAGAWLDQRAGNPTDPPCAAVRRALARHVTDLTTHAHARHDIGLAATARLVHLAGEGHTGTITALTTFKKVWEHHVTTGPDRPADPHEWDRFLSGAVQIAAAAHPEPPAGDPCDNPFHGLLTRPPRPGDTPWLSSPSPSAPSATTGTTPSAAEAGPNSAASTVDALTSPASEPARTTWWPRDLDAILEGRETEPPPTFLARNDGQLLLYAGKTNGVIGESESGKSWVTQLAVKQALDAGHHVTICDFEDTATGYITRLRDDLTIPSATLRERLRYINPDEAFDAVAAGDLRDHLLSHSPALIVLDGVNAAMTLMELDLGSNVDATKFSQRLLRPLTDTGACVVYVDHVPKDRERETKGGIGAQAKRAMTTGCALRAEVVLPFGRGRTGRVKLTVDKDRPGHVRGRASGATYVGIMVLASDPDTGCMDLVIEAPAEIPVTPTVGGGTERRLTIVMEQVSIHLEHLGPYTSRTKVYEGMKETGSGARKDNVLKALTTLINDQFVTVDEAGQIAHQRPYRQRHDPLSTEYEAPLNELINPKNNPPGTGSHRFPEPGQEAVPAVPPPPLRGEPGTDDGHHNDHIQNPPVPGTAPGSESR